jgi:hypothetical protein
MIIKFRLDYNNILMNSRIEISDFETFASVHSEAKNNSYSWAVAKLYVTSQFSTTAI